MALHDWISELTNAGYDVIDSNVHTARHAPGEEVWNLNYPMVYTDFLFHKNKTDVILCAYATNSVNWHIYAIAVTGKVSNKLHGFNVTGTKEKSIENFEALVKFLQQ